MMVTWISISAGVMMKVMERVFDVCQVHQITWVLHPCSWCLSGRTCFSPLWAWGLERICFQATFPLFSLDGVEMRWHHSKWALNELCFSCRLYHWGLGSCMSDHNPRFQLQFLSTKSGDLFLVCWERTVLVHSPLALIGPFFYGLYQTVPSVCSVFQ